MAQGMEAEGVQGQTLIEIEIRQQRWEGLQRYCGNGFAGVPGLTCECFLACAIRSITLSLPS